MLAQGLRALLKLEHQENNLVVVLKVIQELGRGGVTVFARLAFLGALGAFFLFF